MAGCVRGTPARSRGPHRSRRPEHCARAGHAQEARFRSSAKPPRTAVHAPFPLPYFFDAGGRGRPCLEFNYSQHDRKSRRAHALPRFPARRPQEGAR